MRKSVLILAGINLIVWGHLLYVGIDLAAAVARRHAPGYPTPEQIAFYVGVPAGMLVACAAALLWHWRWPRSAVAKWVLAVTLGVLPFYLLPYTGGV